MTDDYIADEYTIDLSPMSFTGTLTIKVVAETPDEAMEKTREALHIWTKEGLPPMCLNMKVKAVKPYVEDRHIACPGYPNCDVDPMGCRVKMGDDVEWYGHRD